MGVARFSCSFSWSAWWMVVLAAVLSTACSSPPSPSSAPLSDPESMAAPVETAATRPFSWPDVGWYRLDLDVEVAVDGAASVSWRASVAATWDGSQVRVWTDAPDVDDPARRHRGERVVDGAAAADSVAAIQGAFAASIAEGLTFHGRGRFDDWVFRADRHEFETMVQESWRIGGGLAPWGSDGPFAAAR